VSTPGSNLAETKSLLLGMVAEANDLKRTAGGSITDAVAGWLAPQYLLAAREKLSGTDGARRWDILRVFVQDWAMLRHGDHTAERLHIERERLKLAKRDTKHKWETKIEAGWDELKKEIKFNPETKAAWKKLYELVLPDIQSKEKKKFREWLKRPEIRKEVFSELTRGLTPETLKKIEEELHLL
jgi:FMN phosphatase YigB (HAD superfamily)